MAKNECDIIELFIKINLRTVDAIYIIDNNSDDGTAEIVKKIQSLNYPVSYTLVTDCAFNQSKYITSAVQEVANNNIYDIIIPLDADEFLYSQTVSPREITQSLMSTNQFGLIPWKTYCPISDDYFNRIAPLYENFSMREAESPQYYKVIIGNEFAKNCQIDEGNHFARNKDFLSAPVMLPLILQHIPVRSKEQIIRKSILGSYALALKKNRLCGEGFHWDLMAKKIRDNDYDIKQKDIFDIALNYSVPESRLIIKEISTNGPKIGNETDTIEFKNLACINLIKSFDLFISNLFPLLNSTNINKKIMSDYQFTTTWFNDAAKNVWDQLIPKIKPKKILEVGSYEGASACYLIDKLAGNDTELELHCIDTWEGGIEHKLNGSAQADMANVENRFDFNIKLSSSNAKNKATVIKHKDFSDICLCQLICEGKKNYFDFIYIDGSHQAPDVLCDAVLAFRLLKVGGHMAFDDYLWSENLPYGKDPLRCPKPAIDAFININYRKINILPAPLYQLYIQKISD